LTAAGLDPAEATALPRFLELYDERLLNHTRLYEGTQEMLNGISRKATLAVLTNKPQRPSERILEGLAIAKRFAQVIGGDTALPRKPDPGGLRHLMAAAGAGPDDTIMVGDSGIDLRTARAAGNRICLGPYRIRIPRAAGTRICLVRYGFGFRFAAAELAGDELLAGTPGELLALLRQALHLSAA